MHHPESSKIYPQQRTQYNSTAHSNTLIKAEVIRLENTVVMKKQQTQNVGNNMANIEKLGRLSLMLTSDLRINSNFCQICCQSFSQNQMATFNECMHYFCISCLHNHINKRIKEDQEIKCCNQDCSVKITISQSGQFEAVDKSYFKIIDKSLAQKIKKYIRRRKTLLVRCIKCNYNQSNQKIQICEQCNKSDVILPEGFKKCPSCSRVIEKEKGCDHLKCVCKHQFCYNCEKTWGRNHICEEKIPKRSGAAYVLCLFFKVILGFLLGLGLLTLFLTLSLFICLFTGMFFGILIFFDLIDKLIKLDIYGGIKFIIFVISLLVGFPIFVVLGFIPGFLLPFINICYKRKIFFDTEIINELGQTMLGCLAVIQIL